MPTVSVVIPTFNYGRFIVDAIESALGQTERSSEIIVVDDGSTDDTAEVVGKFGERVRYVRQENAGVCAARNRGVGESSGDFIAFLDADDTWEPTKLEKQLAEFESDSEIGLVHCGMREYDSLSNQTIHAHLEGGEGWVADEMLLLNKPVVIGPGGTIMVRRKIHDEIGGFDERLSVGEDLDYCYRIARKYKVGFVRESLVNYRSHGKNSRLNVEKMESSLKIFYEKAFATDDSAVQALRSRALGNFHTVLAGTYFRNRSYLQFAKQTFFALYERPENILYYLSFPVRVVKRRLT